MEHEKKVKSLSVFFDTEFTQFRDMEHEPKLISIGLVSEDGREFYCELTDTYQKSDCSDFVLDVVLPLLDGNNLLMEAQLASKLKVWIEGLVAEEVVLRCNSPSYDWELVAGLFNFYDWPSNLRKKCGTVDFDKARQTHRYQIGLAIFWKGNSEQMHHALIDARSMRYAWNYGLADSQ
ncbi:3'-5' exonuclease family protein [Sideroxydans sp.]